MNFEFAFQFVFILAQAAFVWETFMPSSLVKEEVVFKFCFELTLVTPLVSDTTMLSSLSCEGGVGVSLLFGTDTDHTCMAHPRVLSSLVKKQSVWLFCLELTRTPS